MAVKPPIAARLNRRHNLSVGMEAFWIFNEGGGSTVFDSAGKNSPGSLISSPAWVKGKYGNTLSFNGSSSYADLGVIPALNSAKKATICGWVARTSGGGSIAFGTSDGATTSRFQVIWNTDDNLYATFCDGTGGQYYLFKTLSVFGWHFFALVFDGTLSGNARAVLYMDGVPASGVTYNSSPPATLATNANQGSFVVGRFYPPGNFTQGLASSVSIHSRALSASEIRDMYVDPFGVLSHHHQEEGKALSGAFVPGDMKFMPIM